MREERRRRRLKPREEKTMFERAAYDTVLLPLPLLLLLLLLQLWWLEIMSVGSG